MSAWSDRGFRRLALGVGTFELLVLVATVVLTTVAPTSASESTWGSSGRVAESFFQALTFTFPVVGLVVVWRQPRNRIGWLLLAGAGLSVALPGALDGYALLGLVLDPGSVPGPDVAAAITEGSWVWFIGTIGIYLILLFPDGRLPSPRWRWLLWLTGFLMVFIPLGITLSSPTLTESPVPGLANPLAVPGVTAVLDAVGPTVLSLLPVCLLAAAVSLTVRFRRSRGVERQQLKWLAGAGLVVAACYLLAMGSDLLKDTPYEGATPGWQQALQNLALVSFTLLPLAIGAAILRYRLYDIDVVINRALVYGSLTATLAGTYLGSVLLLQAVLRPVTTGSDLAVAVSTLAVAGVFGPARRVIQRGVDHRFYRRRYDAARTVAEFTGRLRHQVDVDAVGDGLLSAVRDTVQPTLASVWLVPPRSAP